jgi:proline dehydrogenase
MLSTLKDRLISRMTASHLAGPEPEDAARVGKQAAALGWASTFGYWDKPHGTPAEAADIYRRALALVVAADHPCYLSIKVTAFDFDQGILMDLLERGKAKNIRIHIDAMDPEYAQRTFDMIERALTTHRNLGCTLPARWQRSVDDTRRVIEYGIPVRVVKGQWGDPDAPGRNARKGYLEVIEGLTKGASLVAVATHERQLGQQALEILTKAGTPCEMEQLSSLPQNCVSAARGLGVPFRVYIPFGFPSLPYDIWQMRTRPQIIGWVLRDALLGSHKGFSAG